MKICLTRFSDPAKSQDPRLQGCPLIGCSSGFGTLCGYTMEDIVGRTANMNCWNHLNEFQMTSNIGVKISMIIWFQEFVDQVVCLFWGTQGNLTSSILKCVWVCLKKIKHKFSQKDFTCGSGIVGFWWIRSLERRSIPRCENTPRIRFGGKHRGSRGVFGGGRFDVVHRIF